MKADLGELDYLRKVMERLESAPHGARGDVVAEAAGLLRCSRQQLYRRLRDVGWNSGRKTRCDRGACSVPEDVAVKGAALLRQATRAKGKRTMTIGDSLDILRGNGEGAVNWETGEVTLPKSATTLSRAMRRYGCHPAQLAQGKPSIRMRTPHPNHTWQVDPSICVLFYLRTGGLAVMDQDKFYKNKPGNVARIANERVWRYVITDHYSGTIYVRYVLSPGETAESLVDVFLDAIGRRGQDDPMHGVPHQLLMDCGSANTSNLFLNLLDRLSVRHLTHLPGNPRAKGSVEVANNIVERRFEGRLAFMKVESLEQLQAEADRWRRHFNAYERHSRTGRTRNDVWLTIAEDQLRLAPPLELCRELVTTKPEPRTVSAGMTITHAVKGFGRNEYDIRYLPGLVPQMKVSVVVNPYRAPAVDVLLVSPTGEEAVYTVEPIRKDQAGFPVQAPVIGQEFKGMPDTVTDKRVKEVEAMTGGTDRKAVHAPEGIDVMADVRQAPTYITKRGRDLDLDASRRELAPMSVTEAAMALKARLGNAWGRDDYAWLEQRYGQGGVPAAELDAIAERLSRPEAKPLALKVVGGGK